MTHEILEPHELDFPYEEDVQELVEDISKFETRVRPRKSEEDLRLDLNHGWQAILYKGSESLIERSLKKIHESFAEGQYRTAPEYEWELEAPNGEVYRGMGVDISPEEFERMVYMFRE